MARGSFLTLASVLPLVILARDTGAWGYLLRNPGAFDLRSLDILLRRALVPLTFIALISLLAAALGRRLIKRLFGPKREPASDLPGAAFALGAGTLACGALLLGLIGALNAPGYCVLGLLFIFLALPELSVPSQIPLAGKDGLAQPLLAVLLALCAWHVLIAALAPPTEWDTLAYHLALPKIYAKSGGLPALHWLLHSHWPHLTEVFYTLPLILGMENAAALWHAALCAGWIFSVWGFGRKIVGERAAWFAAALLAAQPMVLDIAGAAHSDAAFSFFTFMAAAAAWLSQEKGNRPWLLLAGLFAGLAASCKFHGIVQIPAIAVWIAWRRKGFHQALIFLAAALLISSPWYLLAFWRTGNPIWPFFSKIMGGRWGAAAIEGRFVGALFWKSPAVLLSFGPQFLLVPILALFGMRRAPTRGLPGFLKFYLALAVPYILFIWKNDAAWRFMIAFMPALALACGYWADAAFRQAGWRRAAAALALAFGMSGIVFTNENNQLFAVLGLRSRLEPSKDPREIYLERSLDNYRMCSRINRELGPRARLLLFREVRGYYLDADYRWGDPLNQGLILYSQITDGTALLARLSELGITHVLVNAGIGMYMENPVYYDRHTLFLMEEALRLAGKPIMKEGFLTLYELRPPKG